MGITFKDCKAIGGQTGFSFPEGADVTVETSKAIGSRGTGFEVRDRPTFLDHQLLQNVPPALVLAALTAISEKTLTDPGAVQSHVEKGGLSKWLADGANSATLSQALWGIATSPQAQNAILAFRTFMG